MLFAKTSCENLKGYKCLLCEDGRQWRTCVYSTEKTQLRSKRPILAVKMLKNRKKCHMGAVLG